MKLKKLKEYEEEFDEPSDANKPAYSNFRTRLRSSTTNRNSKTSHNEETEQNMDGAFFDAFKKEELRELIAEYSANWLLSNDSRNQGPMPIGLVSNLKLSQQPTTMTLLFPKDHLASDLEYREVHQVIRELTIGIFGTNQIPCLSLEPNFDLSSKCHFPMAYKDTRVGQLLVEVDYAMKSIWHGVRVKKLQREKLSEKWRTILSVNTSSGDYDQEGKDPFKEFTNAGQEFITKETMMKDIYKKLNKINPSEQIAEKESQFF